MSDVTQSTDSTAVESTTPAPSDEVQVDETAQSVIPEAEQFQQQFDQFIDNKKFRQEDGSVDYDKLGKSYMDMEKQFRSKVSATDVAEYKYDFADPDSINSETLDSIKGQFLEQGFTADQFSFVMKHFEGVVSDVTNAVGLPSHDTFVDGLHKTWGDNYDSNVSYVEKAFDTYAPEGMDFNQLPTSQPVFELLARIGASLREDSAPTVKQSDNTLSESEVNDLRNRSDYWDRPDLQKQVEQYYQSTYN